MWYILFYLASIAESLSNILNFTSFVTGIIAFIGSVFYFFITIDPNKIDFRSEINEDDSTHLKTNKQAFQSSVKIWMKFVWIFLVVIFLNVLIPSKKDLLLIVGGGAVTNFIMNDDNAKELPADITKFLRTGILDLTVDLESEVREELGLKSKSEIKRDSLNSLTKNQLIDALTK